MRDCAPSDQEDRIRNWMPSWPFIAIVAFEAKLTTSPIMAYKTTKNRSKQGKQQVHGSWEDTTA